MTAAKRLPRAPSHLTAPSKALYRSIVGGYELEPHHLEILRMACEAIDRAEEARKAVAEHGVLIEGRYGMRANPAESIERQHRASAQSLLRELGLDLEQATAPRPSTKWRPR